MNPASAYRLILNHIDLSRKNPRLEEALEVIRKLTEKSIYKDGSHLREREEFFYDR